MPPIAGEELYARSAPWAATPTQAARRIGTFSFEVRDLLPGTYKSPALVTSPALSMVRIGHSPIGTGASSKRLRSFTLQNQRQMEPRRKTSRNKTVDFSSSKGETHDRAT